MSTSDTNGKKAVNISLPPRLRDLATHYAELNGRKLSSLIEELLRGELERSGIQVNLPPEELLKALSEKLGKKVVAKKPGPKHAKE